MQYANCASLPVIVVVCFPCSLFFLSFKDHSYKYTFTRSDACLLDLPKNTCWGNCRHSVLIYLPPPPLLEPDGLLWAPVSPSADLDAVGAGRCRVSVPSKKYKWAVNVVPRNNVNTNTYHLLFQRMAIWAPCAFLRSLALAHRQPYLYAELHLFSHNDGNVIKSVI